MEEWRDVPGSNGRYQIDISTKEGKCRSLNYKNYGKTCILSGSHNKGRSKKEDERIYWCLTIAGKSKCMQAARWIALTYPELVQNEYFEGAEIDHIDTDVLNNHPSNLRWVTDSEQANNPLTRKHISESKSGEKSPWYGKHHKQETKQKMSKIMRGKLINNKSTSKPVLQFVDNVVVGDYPSASEASRKTGVAVTGIIRCCNGSVWYKTAGRFKDPKTGEVKQYTWKYKEQEV